MSNPSNYINALQSQTNAYRATQTNVAKYQKAQQQGGDVTGAMVDVFRSTQTMKFAQQNINLEKSILNEDLKEQKDIQKLFGYG